MVAQIVVDTAPGHDYHSAAMVNEIDIFRAAHLLVKQHGEDAPIHAAMRADAMLEAGDLDGCAVWKRVLRAVKELQRSEPTLDEELH